MQPSVQHRLVFHLPRSCVKHALHVPKYIMNHFGNEIDEFVAKAKRLDLGGVHRDQVKKELAQNFSAANISFKRGPDKFSPEDWIQLHALLVRHKDLPEAKRGDIAANWLRDHGILFNDLKQTVKEHQGLVSPGDLNGMTKDRRTFAGLLCFLQLIAKSKSGSSSLGAVAAQDTDTEITSKAPATPKPAGMSSVQPSSSNDSTQTEDEYDENERLMMSKALSTSKPASNGSVQASSSNNRAQADHGGEIEKVERALTLDKILKRLKDLGVTHEQDPKKVARVIDIEKAMMELEISFNPKLDKRSKAQLLYDTKA